MSNTTLLLQKLRDIRVLRSSCSESLEGEFRVHLPEREWDEIQGLVKELMELPVSPLGFYTPYVPLQVTNLFKKDNNNE